MEMISYGNIMLLKDYLLKDFTMPFHCVFVYFNSLDSIFGQLAHTFEHMMPKIAV